MYCKWCGSSMKPADQACPSCGKETAPLTDCGGFYGLVPEAKKLKPVSDTPRKAAPEKAPQPETRPAFLSKLPFDVSKIPGSLSTWIAGAVAVILAVVVVVLAVRAGSLSKKLTAAEENQALLQTKVAELMDETAALREGLAERNDTPAPVQPDTKPLRTRELTFGLTVGDAPSVFSGGADFDGTVSTDISYQREQWTANYVLPDSDATAMLEAAQLDRSDGDWVLAFYWKLNPYDTTGFGQLEGSTTYVWKYSVNGGDYQPLPEDVGTIDREYELKLREDSTFDTTLRLEAAELAELGAGAETVQFQVTARRANIAGGVAIMMVENYSVPVPQE